MRLIAVEFGAPDCTTSRSITRELLEDKDVDFSRQFVYHKCEVDYFTGKIRTDAQKKILGGKEIEIMLTNIIIFKSIYIQELICKILEMERR